MYKSTVALALLVIEIVILIFYPKENKSKFFIYPQHWGFAFITLAFFLDASLVISRYIVQKTKKPGRYYKGGHPTTTWTKLYPIFTTYYLIEWSIVKILHKVERLRW